MRISGTRYECSIKNLIKEKELSVKEIELTAKEMELDTKKNKLTIKGNSTSTKREAKLKDINFAGTTAQGIVTEFESCFLSYRPI